MLTLPVSVLVEIVDGELVRGSEDTIVNGIAIDSRAVEPGAAFVALAGERVDGHDFAADALRSGARAVIATRDPATLMEAFDEAGRADATLVHVADAVDALHDLARYHRTRLTCPVVGVTGSTGKTTTKDLLDAVLSRDRRVVATAGNMNNELGLPLTLMRAGVETDVVVLEMAMRGPGQITALCNMARPTHGLVTNVGETHIELLGSREAIAEAKGELVHAIPADGVVFLNGDDAWSEKLAGMTAAPVTTYGLGESCDVQARDVVVDDAGKPSFVLGTPDGEIPVSLAIPGRHNAYNAAAAAAVGLALGVAPQDVADALAEATTSPMRMESFTSVGGITVINDAYNASPTSMRAAVAALLDVVVPGRRIAILGDMAELGSLTELAHFKLGEEVGRSGLDRLITVGEKAARIADGAKATGLDEDAIRRCGDAAEAAEVACEWATGSDAVLVKASRVMGLEVVVEALMGPSCSP